MSPRLLDLFCAEGGAAEGYLRAGFDVVGVDIVAQPRFPFEFHQSNALEVLDTWDLSGFDAVHASPICHGNSNLRHFNSLEYPEQITPTRELLREWGGPWVIENVPGAPMRPDVVLCGEMFGLSVQRHRWFEFSFGVPAHLVAPCVHASRPVGVYGHGQFYWENGEKKWRNVTREEASEAMGIGWMSRAGLSLAIPPAYTEWIGSRLMEHLQAMEAAS